MVKMLCLGTPFSPVCPCIQCGLAYLPTFTFGGTPHPPIPLYEDRLSRYVQFVQLCCGRQILHIGGDVFCPLPAGNQRQYPIGIGDDRLANRYRISRLHFTRRLCVAAIDGDPVGTTRLRCIATCLENPHRPKPFVYSNRFVHLSLSVRIAFIISDSKPPPVGIRKFLLDHSWCCLSVTGLSVMGNKRFAGAIGAQSKKTFLKKFSLFPSLLCFLPCCIPFFLPCFPLPLFFHQQLVDACA